MSNSVNIIARQWLILAKIPKYPRKISTSELKDYLHGHGFEVSSRMIQRDLESLSVSELFPLSGETEGRRNFWFWPVLSKHISLPVMDTSVALTFTLAEEYLARIFPVHVLKELQPYFYSAQETLRAISPSTGDWKKKVSVIHDGPEFIRSSAKEELIEEIYESLFEGVQISVIYKPRGVQEKEYVIHPLGLVSKAGNLYLAGMVNNFKDVRQFSLSRFVSVKKTEETARDLPGFKLEQYVQKDHAFQYPTDIGSTQLILKVNKEFEFFFKENSLGEDQTITFTLDGDLIVKVSIVLTEELEWWLLGRSDLIEVIKPKKMRDLLAKRIESANKIYNKVVI